MKKDEWNTKFEEQGKDGREVPIGKTFSWGNGLYHVPAIYLCEEGLIADSYIEYDREEYREFLEKYRKLFNREKNGGKIGKRDLLQFQWDNPMDRLFRTAVWVNGVQLKLKGGTGMQWIPKDMNPLMSDDIDIAPFMEHYDLEPGKIWQFRRDMYFWEEAGVPEIKSLELKLTQWPINRPGTVFQTPKVGECVAITHPHTGAKYTLTVTELEQKQIKRGEQEGLIFPENCLVMGYTLEPQLPKDQFFLTDLAEDDKPIRTGKGSASSGAFGVILSNREKPENRYTVSSMHYTPVKEVTWQAEFREKTLEDLMVKLI